MKRTSIKKWVLGTLLLLIIISIGSCIGVKSQVNQQFGANTKLLDSSVFKTTKSPIAITNVNVLSADCTKMMDSLTILIKKGKIISVSKMATITDEYNIIDGKGQYLIPGLVDTHVHLYKSKNDLLLFLANGVTSIGEMFGDQLHLEWRAEAEAGSLSPNLYVATRKLASTRGLMPKIRSWFGAELNYITEKKARKAIRKFKKQGYDAIKLSTFLDLKIYQAIVDEAKKQGIPTVGHLSPEVGLEGLYSSGQSQLAHVEEIVKSTMKNFGPVYHDKTEEYLKYLEERCDSIAINIRENNIAVSSTIWLVESFPKQKLELDSFIKTIPLEYVNPGFVEGSRLKKGWTPGNNHYENLEAKDDPVKREKVKAFWDTYAKAHQIMTNALIKNNAMIIAGTDANVPCAAPGFSLHEELISLYNAGLNNAQVLQAATRNGGEWMQNNTGKIVVGYKADLVLLNKNPLEDISNTKTIQAVISNGKLLNRETIDQMLLAIKDANSRSRKMNIDQYIK